MCRERSWADRPLLARREFYDRKGTHLHWIHGGPTPPLSVAAGCGVSSRGPRVTSEMVRGPPRRLWSRPYGQVVGIPPAWDRPHTGYASPTRMRKRRTSAPKTVRGVPVSQDSLLLTAQERYSAPDPVCRAGQARRVSGQRAARAACYSGGFEDRAEFDRLRSGEAAWPVRRLRHGRPPRARTSRRGSPRRCARARRSPLTDPSGRLAHGRRGPWCSVSRASPPDQFARCRELADPGLVRLSVGGPVGLDPAA